jgi:hypothetical protein
LQDAASLAAQVFLGDRIIAGVSHLVSKGKSVITPADAETIIQEAQQAASEQPVPHGDTGKPSASFTPIAEEPVSSPTTASKPSKVVDTSTGSAPTGKEGVSAPRAGTSGPFEGDKYYHATRNSFSDADIKPYAIQGLSRPGIFFSRDLNEATRFVEKSGVKGQVKNYRITPDAKIYEAKNVFTREVKDGRALDKEIERAIAKGYDAVTYKGYRDAMSTDKPGYFEHTILFNRDKLITSPSIPSELASLSAKFSKGGMSEIALREEIARVAPTLDRGLVEDIARDAQAIRENGGNPLEMLQRRLNEGGTPTGDRPFETPVKEPAAQLPQPLAHEAKSKIGKSIEAKAVENGLTKGFSDTAGYDSITIKDQAERASTLINDNIADARAMVRGEKPLPDGLRGTALVTAMEEHIRTSKNAEAAYELANSPLVSETSAHAQEMRLMAERVPDSITAKFKEIKAAREAALEKRGGVKKAVKKMTDEIQTEIKKQKVTPKTWSDFVEQIKCNY